ncbi:hypothetical protein MMC29_004767 [Sticta canariensis]|nr:hypothetical protein [Sticta canariensis]
MAEDSVHKQEFVIRDLSTRSVTLYPSRAHVTRDINDITLQPGANQITIYGLTPTADENSIKVEGRGSATITDMTVDLVVNRELYEEIYPSQSDDSDGHDDDLSDSESENEAMKIFSTEMEKIQNRIQEASEEQASASSQLNFLDRYGQRFAIPRPDNLDYLNASLNAYKEERKRIFQDHAASVAKIKDLKDELYKLNKRNRHVQKATERNRKKSERAKLRKATKKQLARQEKAQAKRRLNDEREYFWPKKVYRVVLSLDTNLDMTPIISRRDSIDSLAKPALPPSPNADMMSISKRSSIAQDSCRIGLAISYITRCAWWSPRYDLSLTTTTGSGMITYRAEFCNKTSESWRDAKVVLSTSQTGFQDLGEAIPNMEPWHICLARGFGHSNMDEALLSHNETQHNRKGEATTPNPFQEPRGNLFGLPNENIFRKLDDTWQGTAQKMRAPQGFRPLQSSHPLFGGGDAQVVGGNSSLFGNASFQPPGSTNVSFGSSVPIANSSSPFQHIQQQQQQQGLAMQHQRLQHAQQQSRSSKPSNDGGETMFGSSGPSLQRSEEADLAEEGESEDETDTMTIIPQDPTIEFEESNWEETGLTATYDVPGIRTIPPSQTTRRHKIASIALKDVQLSYVLVPKLREAAFLKARLRNNSSTTLLKGPVGLTLDGSFLGNSTIPRCSAGDTFSLSLGVDPGITVKYQKPVVRRNQSGVFQKEGSCIFTRSLVVTNTKGNSVLDGVVLDQVPVSEDEKLKVEVLQPRGLRSEGDQVMSGKAVTGEAVKNRSLSGSTPSPGRARGAQGGTEEKWGRAVATLKKAGEIRWNLKLNPGQRVRLDLEYETRFPSSERIIGK